MDLFSRKIISRNISNKADSNLIMSTFNDAYNKRNCPTGLMFHSDRGTQYSAALFRKLLDKFNVVKSINTMKKYKEYMLNAVKYKYSNNPLEGFNNKIKLLKRVSYGYSSFSNFRLRILIMCF